MMVRGKFLTSQDDTSAVMDIRRRVFVDEQGYSADTEIDTFDKMAVYALAFDENGQPAGTGRLIINDRSQFQVGRVCVLKEARGQGLATWWCACCSTGRWNWARARCGWARSCRRWAFTPLYVYLLNLRRPRACPIAGCGQKGRGSGFGGKLRAGTAIAPAARATALRARANSPCRRQRGTNGLIPPHGNGSPPRRVHARGGLPFILLAASLPPAF